MCSWFRLETVRHRATAGWLAALLLALVLLALPAWATELSIDERQMVTASGQSESLRDVVVALCTEARIDLLGFAATDRTVSVDYEDIPLDRFLARLLREESYVVGLKGGADGVRIAWLRVMGPESSSSTLRFDGEPEPPTYLGVEDAVLEEAWSNEDPELRAIAAAKVVEHVRANPGAISAFIDKGYGTLLEEIGDRPHAVELLQKLQAVTESNAEVFQLMGLMQSIRSRQTADERNFKPLKILQALELPEDGADPAGQPQP